VPAVSAGTNAATVSRIAAGVDGYPEGRDAVALAAAIAAATSADLMLVAVHPDPLVVLPRGMNWKGLEVQAEATLREVRDALAPQARIRVATDFSIPRALGRVVREDHRDLLVMGSSRRAPDGHVRIGTRTRQLLYQFHSALAVAPRGLHGGPAVRFARIGVGYDGGQEAQVALRVAASVAAGSGSELRIRGVVDDGIRVFGGSAIAGPAILPGLGWSSVGGEGATPEWEQVVSRAQASMETEVHHAALVTDAEVTTEVVRGAPADRLLELAESVDLIVVGSRRWGPVARLMLGSTGEALLHDAACPVLVVPRPH
jgi:nucleotide-binding universal stress UspA family protein